MWVRCLTPPKNGPKQKKMKAFFPKKMKVFFPVKKGGGQEQEITPFLGVDFWTLKTSENPRVFCFFSHKFLKMHHFFGGCLLQIPTTSNSTSISHISRGFADIVFSLFFLARGVSTSYGSGGLCMFYMAKRCKKEVPNIRLGRHVKSVCWKDTGFFSCKIPLKWWKKKAWPTWRCKNKRWDFIAMPTLFFQEICERFASTFDLFTLGGFFDVWFLCWFQSLWTGRFHSAFVGVSTFFFQTWFHCHL